MSDKPLTSATEAPAAVEPATVEPEATGFDVVARKPSINGGHHQVTQQHDALRDARTAAAELLAAGEWTVTITNRKTGEQVDAPAAPAGKELSGTSR